VLSNVGNDVVTVLLDLLLHTHTHMIII
jgi:hypothetical protein